MHLNGYKSEYEYSHLYSCLDECVQSVWYSPECAQETAYAALRIERNNVAQVEEACRANYIVTHAKAEAEAEAEGCALG